MGVNVALKWEKSHITEDRKLFDLIYIEFEIEKMFMLFLK